MFLSVHGQTKLPPEVQSFMFSALIKFDGVDVKYCVTADEDLGYVDVYVTDQNGLFVINELKDDATINRHYGKVQIIDGRQNFEERPYIECEREVLRCYWPFDRLLNPRKHQIIKEGQTRFGWPWKDAIVSIRYYVDGK